MWLLFLNFTTPVADAVRDYTVGDLNRDNSVVWTEFGGV